MWFPNLYRVKPVETPEEVQKEEYEEEVRKRKKREEEEREESEASALSFGRDIIDRYYRKF